MTCHGKGSSWPCAATDPRHRHQPWTLLLHRHGPAGTLPGTRRGDHNHRRFSRDDLCRERQTGNDPASGCATMSTDRPARHSGAWWAACRAKRCGWVCGQKVSARRAGIPGPDALAGENGVRPWRQGAAAATLPGIKSRNFNVVTLTALASPAILQRKWRAGDANRNSARHR